MKSNRIQRLLGQALATGLALWLCGCSTPPVVAPAPVEPLFDDAGFGPPSQQISADQVMSMSPPMRQYLDDHIRPRQRRQLGREALLEALELSAAITRKLHQNLFWAFAYNAVGIPLAAFGLLNPVLAGAAMAMSSASVIGNALLLKRWKPE